MTRNEASDLQRLSLSPVRCLLASLIVSSSRNWGTSSWHDLPLLLPLEWPCLSWSQDKAAGAASPEQQLASLAFVTTCLRLLPG